MASSEGTNMHELPNAKPDDGIALAAKLAFLQQARSYPDPTATVKTIETHWSWVFLTDQHAYKLKKPERYALLDLSTLSARKYYCEEELRLNRRLAGDVYLGIVPLCVNGNGTLELGGNGSPVDWLVKMRRLPAERMLDVAIDRNDLADEPVRAVARKLAEFYRAATPVSIAPADYLSGWERNIHANHDELRRPVFGLAPELVDSPCVAQLKFVREAPALLEARAREGRIIEAHGDLRPEHICLLEPEPVIIDCLEFNRDLRTLDAAADLAFLAQECERIGAPRVGEIVFDVYGSVTHDHPPATLISFYKSYWACLRAKLCVWHLTDPNCNDPAKWSRLAADYLLRAGRYARAL